MIEDYMSDTTSESLNFYEMASDQRGKGPEVPSSCRVPLTTKDYNMNLVYQFDNQFGTQIYAHLYDHFVCWIEDRPMEFIAEPVVKYLHGRYVDHNGAIYKMIEDQYLVDNLGRVVL